MGCRLRVYVVGCPAVAVVGRGGCNGGAWISIPAAHACITIFGIRGVYVGVREGALQSQSMAEVSGAMKTQVLRVSE